LAGGAKNQAIHAQFIAGNKSIITQYSTGSLSMKTLVERCAMGNRRTPLKVGAVKAVDVASIAAIARLVCGIEQTRPGNASTLRSPALN
jgi:hypothetical protein